MMIFRFCLCCFGFNQNPRNDSKHLLTHQSSSNANKRELYTVHKVTSFGRDVSHDNEGADSDYEATLSTEKPNLNGSKSNLTESKTNTLLSGRRFIQPSSNLDYGNFMF
ncbi:hypothetical protein V9T40_011148 [Parthenolecanium corni]|uniref:Uncharacterized protein n=1 Tax=Parthenolecanium corni TaxID=536013 RepID=A0AAN9XY49_9HEMI